MTRSMLFLCFGFGFLSVNAQQSELEMINLYSPVSVNADTGFIAAPAKTKNRVRLQSFIVPATLLTYGLISLESDGLKNLDKEIQEEIWVDNPHKPFKIDDFMQYAPGVMVYALNAVGIKGENNMVDRSMIYLMANAMMGVTVQSIKKITKIQRPDGGGTNAFPSGHTATAFVAAEFMRREYKSVSPWYGIAGYAMATTTAYLRMYNNKHWFRDLLPGAGIGILSTDLAYLIYPSIKRIFYKNKQINTMIVPYYQDRGGGVSIVYNFRN